MRVWTKVEWCTADMPLEIPDWVHVCINYFHPNFELYVY